MNIEATPWIVTLQTRHNSRASGRFAEKLGCPMGARPRVSTAGEAWCPPTT
jgi:hypothetical protein